MQALNPCLHGDMAPDSQAQMPRPTTYGHAQMEPRPRRGSSVDTDIQGKGMRSLCEET